MPNNEATTMKQNVGIIDTAVRSVVACVLLAVAVEGLLTAPVSIALTVIGLLLWTSCATGKCLLYAVFNIDTFPGFTDDSYQESR